MYTEIQKRRWLFNIYDRLESNDGHITINMNDERSFDVLFEWVSIRGYYHSVTFIFYFLEVMPYGRDSAFVLMLNNLLRKHLTEWKKDELSRIDSLENQPKARYNRHIDLDPYGEENWGD